MRGATVIRLPDEFLQPNRLSRYARRILHRSTTAITTRSLTCRTAITAAFVGMWAPSAGAQPTEEDSSNHASPEAEEPSASVESRTRRGEVFSDLYVGVAVTADATTKLDGVVQEESLLCGAECSSTKSPVGGLRVGWFSGRFHWLGVSGDLSVFIQSWAIQSPYDVKVIPISALLMFRAPLVNTPEHPNGRAQPYLAVGPSLVLSTARLAEGQAALGTARIDSDTAVDPGLDVRFGIRLIASSWISVVLEYRLTYFKPTWQIRGRSVDTTVQTNHFILGLGIHY